MKLFYAIAAIAAIAVMVGASMKILRLPKANLILYIGLIVAFRL